MYITINDIIGEKTIDLSYPIRSGKEIAVIKVLSDNVQYKVIKSHIVDYISPENETLIISGTYAGRKLLSILGRMIELNQFAKDDPVFKMNKLRGITEMSFDLNELDNSDNLKDGRPSNALLTYHMTSDGDFTHFEPHTPQYRALKNGEFTSLTLKITDQNGNIITDGLQVTVVLHIR